jgi:hypothetical protein
VALATPAQIRAGLNTRLATITGLQTYAYMPAQPQTPCAFVSGIDQVTYHDAMQNGLNTWLWKIVVVVSIASPSEEAQADLDTYVAATGTNSVRLAVEGSTPPQTLGGFVAAVVVDSCTGSRYFVTESGAYFGAEFTVRVFAGN